jgi:hypothetical protein
MANGRGSTYMTTDKTASVADQFSSFKDPQRRFVVEAMMLRAEHAYRKARQRAVQYGINLPADPDPPPFTELTERYNKLMEEWAPESVTDAGGEWLTVISSPRSSGARWPRLRKATAALLAPSAISAMRSNYSRAHVAGWTTRTLPIWCARLGFLEREAQHERARPPRCFEYQLGNIGSIADCLAALTIERTNRDQEPLVKAIDYLGYMLRLHQKAAYDAFEALPR